MEASWGRDQADGGAILTPVRPIVAAAHVVVRARNQIHLVKHIAIQVGQLVQILVRKGLRKFRRLGSHVDRIGLNLDGLSGISHTQREVDTIGAAGVDDHPGTHSFFESLPFPLPRGKFRAREN